MQLETYYMERNRKLSIDIIHSKNYSNHNFNLNSDYQLFSSDLDKNRM